MSETADSTSRAMERLRGLLENSPSKDWEWYAGNIVNRSMGIICAEDAALIVALRNTAPALLEVVEAAREWKAADEAWTRLRNGEYPDGLPAHVLDRFDEAERALRDALAKLDAIEGP